MAFTVEERADIGRAARSLAAFALLLGLIWAVLYTVHLKFPFFRNGAIIVAEAKREVVAYGSPFKQAGNRTPVVFFGHSKILSGFIPNLFDELMDGKTYSYNLGMPGTNYFRPLLQTMIDRKEVPPHILIIGGWWDWPELDQPFDPYHLVKDDEAVIEKLFPFRSMPRDLVTFLARSKSRGGVGQYYEFGRNVKSQMLKDRGFYFIEGQSMWPGHRLPDTFALPTDRPAFLQNRADIPEGSNFQWLRSVARNFGTHFYFVPSVYRIGELAAPPSYNARLAEALAPYPEFTVLGPDYFRYPPREFSDHAHLSMYGAETYTRDIVELVKPELMKGTYTTKFPPFSQQGSATSVKER